MDSLNFHSHKTQLVAAAITASLATAGILSAYQAHTRRIRRKELDQDILRSIAANNSSNDLKPSSQRQLPDPQLSNPGGRGGYDENLIREQLARNYAFFGDEAMAKIREGRVAIVGAGGVGSWAAVMLVRSCVNLVYNLSCT